MSPGAPTSFLYAFVSKAAHAGQAEQWGVSEVTAVRVGLGWFQVLLQ